MSLTLHLAIGAFDGVHLGHRAVLHSAREAARADGGMAGVLTYDPHAGLRSRTQARSGRPPFDAPPHALRPA